MKSNMPMILALGAIAMLGAAPARHTMINEDDLTWKEGPPALPKGITIAMLEGDLDKAVPFTFRVRVPKGTIIKPHYHPGDEHVTVIDGTFQMALGEKYDEKALREMEEGDFAIMPKGVRHFAVAKEDVVVQVHGIGPWGITYVNPADDPRSGISRAPRPQR